MSRKQKPKGLFHPSKFVLSIYMALAILAASLPQSARAAVACRTYHFVSEENTKPYIAHTYGLKWVEIAKANDMETSDKLTVGERLCIPFEEDEDAAPVVPEDDPDARIQVSISGGQIIVNLSRFDNEHEYRVKVRDVAVGIGGWTVLRTISIEDDQSERFTFNVPQSLRNTRILSVCLKDMQSDELICRNVANL